MSEEIEIESPVEVQEVESEVESRPGSHLQ